MHRWSSSNKGVRPFSYRSNARSDVGLYSHLGNTVPQGPSQCRVRDPGARPRLKQETRGFCRAMQVQRVMLFRGFLGYKVSERDVVVPGAAARGAGQANSGKVVWLRAGCKRRGWPGKLRNSSGSIKGDYEVPINIPNRR